VERKEQICLASKLLKLSFEDIEKNSTWLSEYNALYISVPIKGGDSLIVSNEGDVLYADSSVSYDLHLSEFLNGRRTPLEAFE